MRLLADRCIEEWLIVVSEERTDPLPVAFTAGQNKKAEVCKCYRKQNPSYNSSKVIEV